MTDPILCFHHSEPHCWLCCDTLAAYPRGESGAGVLIPLASPNRSIRSRIASVIVRSFIREAEMQLRQSRDNASDCLTNRHNMGLVLDHGSAN